MTNNSNKPSEEPLRALATKSDTNKTTNSTDIVLQIRNLLSLVSAVWDLIFCCCYSLNVLLLLVSSLADQHSPWLLSQRICWCCCLLSGICCFFVCQLVLLVSCWLTSTPHGYSVKGFVAFVACCLGFVVF